MNSIHKIIAINNKELDQGVSDAASWHAEYADTSYIYIGNLHESLKEKDILTIFSQYGNPTHINLVKNKDTGKSRGFCYLKYEDQRSCVLAIDNFNGSLIYERPLKVDHTYFKLVGSQQEDDFKVDYPETKVAQIEEKKHSPKLLEQKVPEPALPDTKPVFDDDDFNDPMASMMAEHGKEKKDKEKRDRSHRKHRERRSHRSEGERREKRPRHESSRTESQHQKDTQHQKEAQGEAPAAPAESQENTT